MVGCAFEIRSCRAARTFSSALGALDLLLGWFLAVGLHSGAALGMASGCCSGAQLFLVPSLAAVPVSAPGPLGDTTTNHASTTCNCSEQWFELLERR